MTTTAGRASQRIRTKQDLADHILRTAAQVVRNVNPGCDYSLPWYDAKVAEVAEAMIGRLCQDNTSAGRPDLARVIRAAWDARS